MSDYATSELMRVVERIVMIATVSELDPANACAKVSFGGDAISDWLPFVQLGSKDVRIWCPPVVGSQVVVFSPGGDTTKGLIFPGPYEQAAPDDRATSLRISMPGIDLQMNDGIAFLSLTTAHVKGDIIVDGDVVASGVSLINHVHDGIKPGPANTGKPVA